MRKRNVKRTLAKSLIWLAVAAAAYMLLLHETSGHFWALSALIPFYIKIIYAAETGGESDDSFSRARKRLIATNDVVLSTLMIAIVAALYVPDLIPFALTVALVTDVCGYISPRACKTIVGLGSWIPARFKE